MKAILVVALLALFTGAAQAQMVIDAQTGRAIPVIVSEPSQTCDEAKWRLEENIRMAREQGRPLPPSFIAHSKRRIAHLCGQQ